MLLNQYLQADNSSYISNLYTIDCRLGTNPHGHPKLDSFLSNELLQDINGYYDFSWIAKLSVQTAKYVNCGPECIFFGNGSMPILSSIFTKLLSSESKLMMGIGAQFIDAVSEWRLAGGIYSCVHSCEDLIEGILRDKPSVVYIDNPNNPLGKVYKKAEMLEIAKACKTVSALFLIDEAYGDYISLEESMIEATKIMDHIIVVRSFSKGLGMAGIRLGYAVVSKSMCDSMARITIPFTPSIMSIKVACSALLTAREFMEDSINKTKKTKVKMMGELKKHGIEVLDSDERTPIFMVHMKGVDAMSWFEERGILVESGHHFKGTCDYMNNEYARVRIVGNKYDLEHLLYRLRA